jgi:hypothetical protein
VCALTEAGTHPYSSLYTIVSSLCSSFAPGYLGLATGSEAYPAGAEKWGPLASHTEGHHHHPSACLAGCLCSDNLATTFAPPPALFALVTFYIEPGIFCPRPLLGHYPPICVFSTDLGCRHIPSCQVYFVEMGALLTFCLGWPRTTILPIDFCLLSSWD